MENHAEDDESITTEERDENSSESSGYEEKQSSITTENSSEEEINPWTTLINDAASKVREQYDDVLKQFSCRVTTKVKQNRKPLRKFHLCSKRNWPMSTWIIWHG